MPKLEPVMIEKHSNKRCKRPQGFGYASHDALAALVIQELPKASQSLVIAFAEQQGTYFPVALLGHENGRNLYVTGNEKWIGSYVPAQYRAYPFALARSEDGQQVLCVDEECGLINDEEGEIFLHEDGSLGKVVQDVMELLSQLNANRSATGLACAALQRHDLIKPWPISLKLNQGDREIQGIYRIDENKLNELSGDALIELRDVGALLVAYCQILSMQHLQTFADLAQAHTDSEASLPGDKAGELNLEFLNSSGTISFGNLS